MLPQPVIQRLPKYLTHLRELRADGVEWVSSQGMATVLGLTPSTVRQDLSHLDLSGSPKRGYATETLESALRQELEGGAGTQCLVIIGAGLLGRALALHGGLQTHGFMSCAIFDNDPAVIGESVGTMKVQDVNDLPEVIRCDEIALGVIAVPAEAAQAVADTLVLAGIKGILNLAPTHVRAPSGVTVVDARLLASLQELSYLVRARRTRQRRRTRTPAGAGMERRTGGLG